MSTNKWMAIILAWFQILFTMCLPLSHVQIYPSGMKPSFVLSHWDFRCQSLMFLVLVLLTKKTWWCGGEQRNWRCLLPTQLGGAFKKKNVHPYLGPGEMIQLDLRIFFKWVGSTTNKSSLCYIFFMSPSLCANWGEILLQWRATSGSMWYFCCLSI